MSRETWTKHNAGGRREREVRCEKLEVRRKGKENGKTEEEDWVKGLRIKGIKTTWN